MGSTAHKSHKGYEKKKKDHLVANKDHSPLVEKAAGIKRKNED